MAPTEKGGRKKGGPDCVGGRPHGRLHPAHEAREKPGVLNPGHEARAWAKRGRGVTGHGNGANGEDRGDRSRGGDHRGGLTANRRSTSGSAPASRRGQLERGIQPGADLLAKCLPLETGQGRGRRVEDLEHVGK